MLTFTEADLFIRAGEDMRFADWPAGDFVRRPERIPPREVQGYEIRQWVPSVDEVTQANWRKA